MNEKCGSKQTNFERTWLCYEKFTILNYENNLSVRIEKDKNKNCSKSLSQTVQWRKFLDIVSVGQLAKIWIFSVNNVIVKRSWKIYFSRMTYKNVDHRHLFCISNAFENHYKDFFRKNSSIVIYVLLQNLQVKDLRKKPRNYQILNYRWCMI